MTTKPCHQPDTTHNSCCEKCVPRAIKNWSTERKSGKFCINANCPCHTSKASSWDAVKEFIRTHLDAVREEGRMMGSAKGDFKGYMEGLNNGKIIGRDEGYKNGATVHLEHGNCERCVSIIKAIEERI